MPCWSQRAALALALEVVEMVVVVRVDGVELSVVDCCCCWAAESVSGKMSEAVAMAGPLPMEERAHEFEKVQCLLSRRTLQNGQFCWAELTVDVECIWSPVGHALGQEGPINQTVAADESPEDLTLSCSKPG